MLYGLIFQIIDDLIDETKPFKLIGKTPGKDKKQGKSTLLELMGKKNVISFCHDEINQFIKNNNPTIMQLEKLLNEQSIQLDQLMIRLDEKLQYLLSNISPTQIDTIPNIEFSVSFNTLPSLGLENARLIREVELQNVIQQILIPQFEQAKLEETKNIPTLQIIDKPKVALNKTKPKRSLIVIGSTIMSFLMSLIFVYTDHRTKEFRLAIKQSKL